VNRNFHLFISYTPLLKKPFKGGTTINKLIFDPINKTVGAGIPFQRVRRITGYLVGDLSRFNNAKLAEVKDREKHMKKEKH
jgi:hypothetical protein